MKYEISENLAWHSEIIVIEALAKVELLEKELKNTNYKVTGVGISSVGMNHEESRVTDAMLNILSKSTGLEIQYLPGKPKKQIKFVIESTEV